MRTAIFDLDGTLVDTAIDLMIAGNYTFEELGWAVRLTQSCLRTTIEQLTKTRICMTE